MKLILTVAALLTAAVGTSALADAPPLMPDLRPAPSAVQEESLPPPTSLILRQAPPAVVEAPPAVVEAPPAVVYRVIPPPVIVYRVIPPPVVVYAPSYPLYGVAPYVFWGGYRGVISGGYHGSEGYRGVISGGYHGSEGYRGVISGGYRSGGVYRGGSSGRSR
jgi:hypothetical protein